MIFIVSRYYNSETLFGGEKFSKRFFEFLPEINDKVNFIDFYRGYSVSSLLFKVVGYKRIINADYVSFLKLGIIPILYLLIKNKPTRIFFTTLEGYSAIFLLNKIFRNKCTYINIIHSIFSTDLEYQNKDSKMNLFLRWKISKVESLLFNYCNFLVFPSNLAISDAQRYYNLDKERLKIIPHGVDDKFFIRRNCISLYEPLKLIFVGGNVRLVKGFEFLLSSLERVPIKIDISICGQLDSFPLISNSHINLNYLGEKSTSELAGLYKQHDIFLLPSQFETYGIAALEAMAAGLVVIMTRDCGLGEYALPNKDFIQIQYGNEEEFLERIIELHNNRDLLKFFSKNAIAFANKLRWKFVIPKYFTQIG
ncbi:MAG: glycosyltransferase [Ignavibacteriales bacterium]|jgi:glycosyltransferase involved in cell wall biosynthesis|nr:MAG: glycosyltransferase [Ignavibacteriales bacterium]